MPLDLADLNSLQNLAPRNSPYWTILEFCRHLGVRVLAEGDHRWMARIRTRRGTYRITALGKVGAPETGGMDHANALKAADAWFTSEKISPLASDPYPRGANRELLYCPFGPVHTVAHALQDYVEWKRIAATKSHFETNLSLINHHILPGLGTVPLDALTGREVAAFALHVLETPPKRGNQTIGPRRSLGELSSEELRKRKGTLNTVLGILRMAVRIAWENGRTDSERAWRCIRRVPNGVKPRTTYLNRSECTQLLEWCRPDLRNLVLGALYTGCRATELDRMLVRDVAREVYGVYVAPVKSYRPRYVFLPDEGMVFFQRLCAGRRGDEPVFLHRDGASWRGRYKHLFRATVTEAGLPDDLVFHGLRHTYASQLVQAGTPLVVVAQQLGHASPDTVGRTYGHLAPQITEAQVQRNFAPLVPENVQLAKLERDALGQLSRTIKGKDWRAYGQTDARFDWPRSNFHGPSIDLGPEVRRDRRLAVPAISFSSRRLVVRRPH